VALRRPGRDNGATSLNRQLERCIRSVRDNSAIRDSVAIAAAHTAAYDIAIL